MKTLTNTISIEHREIGGSTPPFIVAELSANHNGHIENAFKLIEMAKTSGANAVKLQTYTADTLTIKCDNPDFKISNGLWAGKTLHDLYQMAHTPWDWHEELFKKARELEITIFSSPFDETAVDLLEDLNCPAYKIASFELIDHQLLAYAAQTKKPLILSTGMASKGEIIEAVDTIKSHGCTQFSLLKCVSAYPANPEDYNLKTIQELQSTFNCPVGLSDHTIGSTTAITSVALGASIIEKHFTLNKLGNGLDDSFSIEPHELKELCLQTKMAWQALGQIKFGPTPNENASRIFRRSLYAIRDIAEGELFSAENIKSIRPGYGLPPKNLDTIIGKATKIKIKKGTPISWDLISEEALEL